VRHKATKLTEYNNIKCTGYIVELNLTLAQGQFYVGAGSPNLGLASKCDMEHCLNNSKHRHICAKRSVPWPSKYAKMRFRPGIRPGPHWESSRRTADLLVGWGGEHPSSYPPHPSRRLWRLDLVEAFLSRIGPATEHCLTMYSLHLVRSTANRTHRSSDEFYRPYQASLISFVLKTMKRGSS